MMQKYQFRHAGGDLTEVVAETERNARRAAMVKKWGPRQSAAVPYAPNYYGTGLALISVAPAPVARKVSNRQQGGKK